MTHQRLSGTDNMLAFASKAGPSFRKGAIALTTAATIGASMMFPQTGFALTSKDCKGLAGLFTEYTRAQPKGTFSADYINSVVKYIIPDGKTPDCSGPSTIAISTMSDFAGWTDIETGAKANGINVMREVKISLLPGSDPRLPNLVAQRERALAQQAAANPR